MIKEVIYYQAQCDICGGVDDGGDFTAWSDPGHAAEQAVGSDWGSIDIELPDADGHTFVRARNGVVHSYGREFLICNDHEGRGISWCATCEDDLDESKWAIEPDGLRIVTTCSNGHANAVTLYVPESEGSES